MNKEPKIYLNDILNHVSLAQRFAGQMTYQELVNNIQACYAISRCLEIIGEASSKIPLAFREKYPEIPWSRIISMRNIIVHDYSGVDYLTLWETLKKDLPELKQKIEKILADR